MNFKDLRLKLNLTQVEICKKLCITQGLVSMWETNKTKPRIEMIPKIAKALQVSEMEILNCFKKSV